MARVDRAQGCEQGIAPPPQRNGGFGRVTSSERVSIPMLQDARMVYLRTMKQCRKPPRAARSAKE